MVNVPYVIHDAANEPTFHNALYTDLDEDVSAGLTSEKRGRRVTHVSGPRWVGNDVSKM